MYKLLLYLFTTLIVAIAVFLYETPRKATIVESSNLDNAIQLISEKNNGSLQSALHLLQEARRSILIFNYAYNNQELLQMLNRKAREGVEVTVVYDHGKSHSFIGKLDPSITKITREQGEGYVHHKVIVTDDDNVWFSSTNFDSVNAKNITIVFKSAEIALAFEREAKSLEGKQPRFRIQPINTMVAGQRMELFILPHNDPKGHYPIETAMNEVGRRKLLRLINQAKKSIRASVVVFTYKDIAIALANAVKRGVDVQIVGSNIDSEVQQILHQGKVPFRKITGPYHHKWMLIDDEILWNGSANWSRSAFSRTDDSVIVLYDLSPKQLLFFQKVWQDLSASSF